MWIRCIDDKKESELIKKMGALEKSKAGKNRAGLRSMQQLLSTLLFNHHNYTEPVKIPFPLDYSDQYAFHYRRNYYRYNRSTTA